MKIILALLADWANGLFAVLIVSHVFSVQPEWWYFVIGIILSHSPDIDAIPEFLARGKVAASSQHPEDHRSALHYPILVLPLLGVVVYFFPYWGSVTTLVVFLHYVNDLYGTGWGIKLLWPITNTNYKLLGRRVNMSKIDLIETGLWDQLPEDEKRFRIIVKWKSDELPDYIIKYGNEQWIEDTYLKFNWISIVEYSVFLLAFILVFWSLI